MDMVDQIDIERLMLQEDRPEGTGYSALPALVRELIRTPGFKELLLIHLRDVNPENARELVKTAIWEDVAFTMSVLGASPDLVNWLSEALVELGVQLNNFTLDILRDFLVQLGRDLDVEKLRAVPSASGGQGLRSAPQAFSHTWDSTIQRLAAAASGVGGSTGPTCPASQRTSNPARSSGRKQWFLCGGLIRKPGEIFYCRPGEYISQSCE